MYDTCSQSSSSSTGLHFTKKFDTVTKTTCGCSDDSEFLSFFDSAAVAGLRFFLILLLLFPLTACADLHPATRDFLNFCNIEKKNGTVVLYSALLKFDNNSRFQNISYCSRYIVTLTQIANGYVVSLLSSLLCLRAAQNELTLCFIRYIHVAHMYCRLVVNDVKVGSGVMESGLGLGIVDAVSVYVLAAELSHLESFYLLNFIWRFIDTALASSRLTSL